MSSPATEVQAAATRRRAWYAPLITHRYLYLMLVPGALVLLIYRYLPMYGLTIAFKNFRLSRGIWRSRGWGSRTSSASSTPPSSS